MRSRGRARRGVRPSDDLRAVAGERGGLFGTDPRVTAAKVPRGVSSPAATPRADDAGREARRCHGGGPTRGDAVTDLPLIKATKLWAKVSQRTGATYLTGRWGGCRVLVFENLERASEAEPSHFLFLGEAGEWLIPDQATAPAAAAEPAQVPELRVVPAATVEDGAGEKPVRRRRKVRGDTASKPPRKARKRREGWNGSVYRRPSKDAPAVAEAGEGPFIEDPLDDSGEDEAEGWACPSRASGWPSSR